MTTIEQAIQALDAKILEAAENPKPTYSIGGQSVSWGSYLSDMLASREKLIAARGQDEQYFHVSSGV